MLGGRAVDQRDAARAGCATSSTVPTCTSPSSASTSTRPPSGRSSAAVPERGCRAAVVPREACMPNDSGAMSAFDELVPRRHVERRTAAVATDARTAARHELVAESCRAIAVAQIEAIPDALRRRRQSCRSHRCDVGAPTAGDGTLAMRPEPPSTRRPAARAAVSVVRPTVAAKVRCGPLPSVCSTSTRVGTTELDWRRGVSRGLLARHRGVVAGPRSRVAVGRRARATDDRIVGRRPPAVDGRTPASRAARPSIAGRRTCSAIGPGRFSRGRTRAPAGRGDHRGRLTKRGT